MEDEMENEKAQTRSEKVNEEIVALLRARHTLLWVTTLEEGRVERAIVEAAASASYVTRFWDCAAGLTDAKGKQLADERDPSAMLNYVAGSMERVVYVLRDLHKWLDAVVLRALRNLAKTLQSSPRNEQRTIVILTPSAEIPPELAGHATVIDYPLPDRREIEQILDDTVAVLSDEKREAVMASLKNGAREAAIDAATGLMAEEVGNCYAKSLVKTKPTRIDPSIIGAEKRRVISRSRVLSLYEPDPRGLDAVGGQGGIKAWLRHRRAAFSRQAREYGLQAPRGILLLGPAGTGKSLIAKCVAAAWQMPLLRLDMGALKSKWVGESEANIRKALQVAEAVSPCILWLDEIEKALAGSTGPQGDGGVAADALGAILSWMQERQGSVFVVATANDVSSLPPELLRKGRFDEIFFIDLPTATERLEILQASLKQYGREIATDDLVAVAAETNGFTGAEIAGMVPDAMFTAFNDGARALTADDLLAVARTVIPLSKTASEKVEALRKWAKGRARPASLEQEETKSGRVLDM